MFVPPLFLFCYCSPFIIAFVILCFSSFIASVILPAVKPGRGSQGRDEDEEQRNHRDAGEDVRTGHV